MIFTTLNENGEIIFNEVNKEPVKCPYCHSADVHKQGVAYKCPECHQTFMPNDIKDDE